MSEANELQPFVMRICFTRILLLGKNFATVAKPVEFFSEPANSTETENSLLALHEHRACLPAGHRLTPTRRTETMCCHAKR
ncbi:hypothetical protein NX722_03250 [Endozoicomonas gorgoniicola]|uniref:Uncharacterized protein n=1 Tax=Endozoicomonas gorgoniicola TaxID=1234144 RepID=A0ABT3MQM0_9GAMM|nr:hypothetical protein [Endozoicomonas gorgoniicola]MCW7551674.1 hypothetical protein [Endozoicomonas gorgoniicola]MCW7551675.1 hypothetical protein [Endozoicomonas gorgoniicola]